MRCILTASCTGSACNGCNDCIKLILRGRDLCTQLVPLVQAPFIGKKQKHLATRSLCHEYRSRYQSPCWGLNSDMCAVVVAEKRGERRPSQSEDPRPPPTCETGSFGPPRVPSPSVTPTPPTMCGLSLSWPSNCGYCIGYMYRLYIWAKVD